MVKIHILGGPGSGKTTLAQALVARFDIPHYDLDQIGWKHGDDMAAYIEDAFTISEQLAWVTEGIYLIWIDPLLYQADYIVLLEIAWHVALWRILIRHISQSLRGVNPYPTKLLFNFLKDSYHYYSDKVSSDPAVAESVRMYLAEHGQGIEAPKRELLLTTLETYRQAIPLAAVFARLYLEKYKEKVFVIRTDVDRRRFFELVATTEGPSL